MDKTSLSLDRLRELFIYYPETGLFTRRVSVGKVRAGDVLRCPDKDGYIQVMIDYRKYKVHRLAWLYVHSVWPRGHIDHINGDPSDNRISNLREATDAFNQQNRSAKSGTIGAHWDATNKKWCATIGFNRKCIHLGRFSTVEEAHAAYLAAKQRLHTFSPHPR